MATTLLERLTAQMEQKVNSAYIDEDIMGAFGFEAVNLDDISIEKWMHKNLSALPEAAVHAAGFNPQDATLDAEEFGHKVFTVDERIILSERDWAFAQKHGIATLGLENLGKMVGKGASRFFMTGRDGRLTAGLGEAVEGNTNFLLDEGTGSGTLTRPLTVTKATAGAWSTWANSQTDILDIIANHQMKNYNLGTSVLLYPKCATKSMMRGGAATRESSPLDIAFENGIMGAAAIPDQYMVTVANALPVVGAFDLALVDLSTIKIGYTRPQRTRTIIHPEGRGGKMESEVWFVPYFTPQLINVAGTDTFYKGVSTITAINGT
jgi:hypothetical protein